MVTLLGALPISSSGEMDFSEPFKHRAVLIDQNKIKFSVKKKQCVLSEDGSDGLTEGFRHSNVP